MATQDPVDWVTRAADDAIRHHEQHRRPGPVTCSSGISPSGPVHLGNLREFLMPHFVADELRRRGVPVRHLHVWDDYDRFRKVPAASTRRSPSTSGGRWSAVPDPWGCHDSWSTHFKEPVLEALRGAGRRGGGRSPRPSATAPASTATRCCAPSATARRSTPCWREHRTRKAARGTGRRTTRTPPRRPRRWPTRSPTTTRSEPARAAGGVGYFPFKPYCRDCGRDTTTVTAYDDDTTDLAYTCSVCDYHGTTNLATQDEGKLVWKADWPMRWAFEHVDFEPAGMDHATPGSSFTVGHELVESVWDYPRPAWFGYGFVGFAGVQKMSSSAGGAPTAQDALRVLEPGILRWLYVRRQPKQTFDIDFGPGGRAAVRRVGRAGPEGRRPRASATSRCWPTSGPRRPRPPGRCRRPRSSSRSGCCRRSPT